VTTVAEQPTARYGFIARRLTMRLIGLARREPLLVVAVGVGAALRFATLDQQSFWADEAYTAELVRGSLGDVLNYVPRTESTPPAYYILAWFWAQLFGVGEVGLRSFSAVAGTLMVPFAYLAGAKLVSRRTGLIAAGLVATSPLLVWYSQEARAYGLMALLGTISMYLFAIAARDLSRGAVIGLGAVSALALATHYFAVLLFVAQAAFLLTRRSLRGAVLWAAALVGLVALALAPLVLEQHPDERTGWIEQIELRERIQEIPAQFIFGQASLKVPYAAGLAALAGLVLASGFFVLGPRARGGASLALAVAIGTATAALVARAGGFDFVYYRPLIHALFPAILAASAVLAAPRLGRLGTAAALFAVVASAALTGFVAVRADLHRENWRYSVASIGDRDSSRVIVVSSWWPTSAFEYYRPTMRFTGEGPRIREVVFLSLGSHALLRAPTGFRLVEARSLNGFTLSRFRAKTAVSLRPTDLVKEASVQWWARLDIPPPARRPPQYGIEGGRY
jgi:hypothetical protein